MATFEQKLSISAFSAVLFAIANLPATYQLTNGFFNGGLYDFASMCPTNLGLLVHLGVFAILTFLTMGDPRVNTYVKAKHTLYGSLIFFLISNPATFQVTNGLLGGVFGSLADNAGCPTMTGIFVHAIVYCAILVAVMYLPEENK